MHRLVQVRRWAQGHDGQGHHAGHAPRWPGRPAATEAAAEPTRSDRLRTGHRAAAVPGPDIPRRDPPARPAARRTRDPRGHAVERVRRPATTISATRPWSAPRCATPSTTATAGPSPCSASARPRGGSPRATSSSDGRRNCARRTSSLSSTTRGSSFCLGSRSLISARTSLPSSAAACPTTGQSATTRPPVLIETFVETPRHTGAVYNASGWIRVGTTQGRGRYDRHTKRAQPKKDIWLRTLRKDWKRTLNR